MVAVRKHKNLVRATKKELEKAVLDLAEDSGDTLNTSWIRASNAAIRKAIDDFKAKKGVKSALKAMLKTLDTELDGVVNKTARKKIKKSVRGLYELVKKSQSAKYKAEFVMGSIDQSVVSAIANDSPYWIGKFYDKHLSAKIADVGRTIVVEGGLSITEGAKEMEKVLRAEFALKGGSKYESAIPSPFSGRVGGYNRILVANSASRVRNYADISAMSSAGIVRYEISAVMDNRTSEICRNMNGRIFTVQQGMQTLTRYAAAESPEEFQEASPWVSVAQAISIAGTGTITSQSKNLSAAGLNLPPYHGLCRTVTLVHGV